MIKPALDIIKEVKYYYEIGIHLNVYCSGKMMLKCTGL